jgi:hypothetical protein
MERPGDVGEGLRNESKEKLAYGVPEPLKCCHLFGVTFASCAGGNLGIGIGYLGLPVVEWISRSFDSN